MRLGKTVTELRLTMPMSEFNGWLRFHQLNPIDDLHTYHRPAALIAQCIGGGKIEDKIAWLQPPPAEKVPEGYSEVDMSFFKAFGLKPPGIE